MSDVAPPKPSSPQEAAAMISQLQLHGSGRAVTSLPMTASPSKLSLLLDVPHEDVLPCILTYCDIWTLGLLEMTCKTFAPSSPTTPTCSAWKELDKKIPTGSKYPFDPEDTEDEYTRYKTSVVRFTKAARLADRVQPCIASHRHVGTYVEEQEDMEEFCTGCAGIPDHLDAACFESEHRHMFLRIFSKSDQRTLWQGFVYSGTNYMHFRKDFDPVKHFPEILPLLDAMVSTVPYAEVKDVIEGFFGSIGLILVSYDYSSESATLAGASTEFDQEDSSEWLPDAMGYRFRGLPLSTHYHAPDEDEDEDQPREDPHTSLEFLLANENELPDQIFSYRTFPPEFFIWNSSP